MIEAKVNKGETDIRIEGTAPQILSEGTIFCKTLIENVAKESGVPVEIIKAAFSLSLKLI